MSLLIGMILDAVFGEPKAIWDRVPHPAIIMGQVIGALDKRLNAGDGRRAKGAVVIIALVAAAVLLGRLLGAFGWPVEAIVVAVLLAQKSLVEHVAAVARGLRMSLGEGRGAVAMIVGRDTRGMDAPAVARAAIESAAENFSDGVAAPVFWFLVGGLPGLLAYKIVNTADSMIGYRTERHAAFGWAAARLDDLLNLIPARGSALLIAGVTGGLQDWREIADDARLHRSPNAGWPEAAMARALNVALAGPRSYDGEMRDFPLVHAGGTRNIGPDQVDAAVRVLWRAWAGLLVIAALFTLLF